MTDNQIFTSQKENEALRELNHRRTGISIELSAAFGNLFSHNSVYQAQK